MDNVEEFEDKLVFINEGALYPKPSNRHWNPDISHPITEMYLCNAMTNLYMIDTNSMGIPMIYQIQRGRCFPLPTYDLSILNRVKVTVFGKILDKNYTQLLYSNESLDMQTVFMLDKVQKKEVISRESYKQLIVKALETMGEASKQELAEVLEKLCLRS